MKVKAPKPTEVRTKADITAALLWCEEMHIALSSRIRIYTDTFNIPRRWSKMWRSKQVKQDERGVCDSPFIQALRARCDDHIKAQVEDFSDAVHFASVSLDVANDLLKKANLKHDVAKQNAGGEVRVEKGNIGGLNADDAAMVESHDEAVQRRHLASQVGVAAQEIEDLQALVVRAERVFELLLESCTRNAQHAQLHFREQALSHLAWAHASANLHSPYLLPGSLEQLPDLFPQISEEVTQDAA